MNHDERKLKAREEEMEDAELTAVLGHFRQSVKAWSDQEFSRTRPVEMKVPVRSFWSAMRGPVAGWAMGCVIAAAAVGVPVTVHHQHVVAEQAYQAQYRAHLLQQQREAEAALQAKAAEMSDEELLDHVDSDIAQATPDAMEPLARLMSDSAQE